MDKRVWKLLFILMPLVMLVATLYYSNTVLRYFEESVYSSVKEEKVKAMKIFAHSIDELVNAGFSWETDGALYDKTIQAYVEILNTDNAIYSAIVNKEYHLHVELFNCDDVLNIFEDEINKKIIIDALGEATFGRVDIILNGKTQEMFFQAIPLNNIEYWVLIGMDRKHIINGLDLDRLRIPIFIIGLLFVVSTMDSIWQRIVRIRRM